MTVGGCEVRGAGLGVGCSTGRAGGYAAKHNPPDSSEIHPVVSKFLGPSSDDFEMRLLERNRRFGLGLTTTFVYGGAIFLKPEQNMEIFFFLHV